MMVTFSNETNEEIERRVRDLQYQSADELLRDALAALDACNALSQQKLEQLLLEGLEGEDIEYDPEIWQRFEQEIASEEPGKSAA